MKTSRISGLLGALAVAMLVAGPVQAGPVYKWVDANGKTHYGEKAPEGAKAQKVKVTDTTSSDAEDEIQELQGKRAATKAEQEKAAKAEKPPAMGSKDDKERLKALCAQHEKNLSALQTGQRLMIKDDQGNARYLTEQETADKLSFTQGEVKRCQDYGKAAGTPP